MDISIYPPSGSDPGSIPGMFALKQDRWNDFSFQTLYHLYYQPTPPGRGEAQTAMLIGPVKILKRGQTKSDGIQINEPFPRLSRDFCSVGNSLDYYQRLSLIAPEDSTFILSALNDVVRQPELREEFRGEPGWEISLFRDNSDPGSFLTDAEAMLTGEYANLPELTTGLSFHPTGWSSVVELNFDKSEPPVRGRFGLFPPPPGSQIGFPKRMIVLIGRNGSGKSTLLSRMARVAYASPDERTSEEGLRLGELSPSSVGFTRVIAISYSAFDSFILPASSKAELRQLASDVQRGTSRYVFAGLRDIAAEAEDDVKALDDVMHDPLRPDAIRAADRKTTTKLKTLAQLAQEFSDLVGLIWRNGDADLFNHVMESVLLDPSFLDVGFKTLEELLAAEREAVFLRWSTGHKIVMHVLTSLVAHTKHRSLVLFDEPESHLHPPLIAALMHAVRKVLERRKAFALVATHSPVVLQETLAQHVRLVERIGQQTSVTEPDFETFGENLGILTYNTFQLTAETTDFHEVLDRLVARYDTEAEISHFFSHGLSGQAMAYVKSGLARKSRGA